MNRTERINRDDAGFPHHLRFLMYSHDGVGLGHLRRNLAIAEAVSERAPECSILLASGASPVGQFTSPGNIDFLKLPELRKIENDCYGPRRLAIPQQDILALRSSILKGTIESFRPDVVLVDKHPLGAGGEMEEALDLLKGQGGAAVLGLRDILDSRESVRHEWFENDLVRRVPEIYNRVFVYGQRDIFDPISEYNFPASIAERVDYCGYVVNQTSRGPASDSGFARIIREPRLRPLVLATVGGGEDGYAILQTFIEASRGALWQGIVVAGPMMPMEEMQLLQKSAAEAGVFFEPFVAGLESFLGCFDGLVCMGGYNTLLESAATGVPTICVPRKVPRREQEMRASTFEQLGLLRALYHEELYPHSLRAEIESLLHNCSHNRLERSQILDISGAQYAAQQLLHIAVAETDAMEAFLVGERDHSAAPCADQVN